MKLACDRLPGARGARRVLLAVASAAMAAGVMAGPAGAAAGDVAGPAVSTATGVMQPAFGCGPNDPKPECNF